MLKDTFSLRAVWSSVLFEERLAVLHRKDRCWVKSQQLSPSLTGSIPTGFITSGHCTSHITSHRKSLACPLKSLCCASPANHLFQNYWHPYYSFIDIRSLVYRHRSPDACPVISTKHVISTSTSTCRRSWSRWISEQQHGTLCLKLVLTYGSTAAYQVYNKT